MDYKKEKIDSHIIYNKFKTRQYGCILNKSRNRIPGFCEKIQIVYKLNNGIVSEFHGIWPCNSSGVPYCYGCIDDEALNINEENRSKTSTQTFKTGFKEDIIKTFVDKKIHDKNIHDDENIHDDKNIRDDFSFSKNKCDDFFFDLNNLKDDYIVQYFKHGSIMDFTDATLFKNAKQIMAGNESDSTLAYHRRCFILYFQLMKKYIDLLQNVRDNFKTLNADSSNASVLNDSTLDNSLKTIFEITNAKTNIIFYLGSKCETFGLRRYYDNILDQYT